MVLPAQQPGGLVVVGEATTGATPDIVTLTAGVQTAGTSAALALRENAAPMLRVVQALLGLGINQTDIQAAGLNVYPQTGQPAHSELPAPIVGYYVFSSLKVTLRDTNRVGEVLDAAIGAGANFGIGLSLGLREESAARCAVLEAAGKDARAKAEVLARAVGKQLGDPVSVVEELALSPTLVGGPGGANAVANSGALAGGAGTGATPIPLGQLTYGARVRVAYGLR